MSAFISCLSAYCSHLPNPGGCIIALRFSKQMVYHATAVTINHHQSFAIMNINNIICPVSTEKIDLNVSRLTVFLNVLLMGLFVYTLNPIYLVIVTIDYFIRAVLDGAYSPIRYAAVQIVGLLPLEKKPIGLAQKVFASRLGLLCAIVSGILLLLGNTTGSIIAISILLVLSFADSVLNFCVGCLIYNYVVYPFYKNK